MKTNLLLGLFLAILLPETGSANDRSVNYEFPNVVNSNSITVALTAIGEVPELMAVIVTTNYLETSSPMENPFDHAKWLPFKTNLLVELGPGDGKRQLTFAYRYKGQAHCDGWGGAGTEVRTALPTIAIYSPPEGKTSQPVIELKGYTSQQALNIKYRRANEAGQMVGSGEGLVNDQHFDQVKFDFTTNYFTCYDVALDPGTNTFYVSADDYAGNHFSSKYVVVFTTVGDTNPPVFKIDWPTDGMGLSGSAFDIRGPCDDPTAKVTVLVCDDDGKTTQLDEPSDHIPIYVTYVPLAAGNNYITVVARDVAGNSSLTNLTVYKSSITLTIDGPKDGFAVTGFCSDTNRTVFVNGTKAVMKPDGHWGTNNFPFHGFIDVTTDGDYSSPPTSSWLPTVYSQPVENNSLQAALFVVEVGTNEYNHYRVNLGFTNASGGEIPRLIWMLPREDARFSLRLYDPANKEIARQEWRGKSGQPLTTNLNIHHLGKNEVEQIGGILPFPTNATVRTASLNLDQMFQLPPPGDYRLEVTERMFKIAADGQLVPFEFPPISTTIKIIDQPSEMVFYLNDLARQSKLIWGAERDGLRIGVAHGMKWSQIKDANQIEVFLQNTATNNYRDWNLRFPKPNEQFDVTLYDAGGKEVPKTALGKQQGQPLSLDGQNPRKAPGLMDEIKGLLGGGNVRHGRGIRPVFVFAKDATDCGRFNLNDYFEIKIPGKYRLTYQQRFYRSNTNSILTGIIMPMVIVPLDITYIPGQ